MLNCLWLMAGSEYTVGNAVSLMLCLPAVNAHDDDDDDTACICRTICIFLWHTKFD